MEIFIVFFDLIQCVLLSVCAYCLCYIINRTFPEDRMSRVFLKLTPFFVIVAAVILTLAAFFLLGI